MSLSVEESSEVSMGNRIKTIVVEDDPEIRLLLESSLRLSGKINFIGAFESIEDLLLAGTTIDEPDIVLLDLQLPGVSGIAGLPSIKKQWSNAEIVVLTIFEDKDKIFSAFCVGACGYLLKTSG